MSNKEYWRLEVSFPFNHRTYIATGRMLDELIGDNHCDGGAGFGMRDLGWLFHDEEKVKAAMEKVIDEHPGYNVSIHHYPPEED